MMQLTAAHIKNIELYTKRLMHMNLLGHARSAVKGSGLEFDQLRDYQIGDDVRAIDWNSSARMNKLLIKQFNDERHRTIIVALDISASVFYGSDQLKHDILAQIAAIVSYAGQLSKDEVGLILFTNEIELYIPPHKGRAHIQLILEKIFSTQTKNAQTSINTVVEYIARLRKKNAMVFLISDFIDTDFEKNLSIIGRICDVIAVRMVDGFEKEFPAGGLITVQDSETGSLQVIDARLNRNALKDFLHVRLDQQKKMFNKHRIDVLDITHANKLIDQLAHFFRIRKR